MKESEIHEHEERLRKAQLASDVAELERLLDDGLVFTAIDGSVAGKEEDLRMHRSGRLRIARMDRRDARFVDLGDVVVASVGMDAEAVVDGAVARGPLRYTRVWAKRSGGWRVVAGHMSAAASSGADAESADARADAASLNKPSPKRARRRSS